MSLKYKSIVILMVFIILYAAAFVGIARFAIAPGLSSLQKLEAIGDMERVLQALDRELHHLSTLCWDWAAWDATYSFVEKPTEDYIKSNIPPVTFTDNKISLIHIYDKTGKLIWGETRDPETGKKISPGKFPGNRLTPNHPLRPPAKKENSSQWPFVAGYFAKKPMPLMLVARPIVSSNNSGPSRGTLVMGRLISNEMTGILSKQTGVTFHLFSAPTTSVSGIGESATQKITPASPYIVNKMKDGMLKIYATLPDLTGNASILVGASVHSRILEIGYPILRFSLISVIIAGMGILVLAYLLIKMSVLSPLAALTGHINDIEKGGEPGKIPFLQRRDEIGMLAKAYDKQLQTLASKTAEISEVNRRLEHDLLHRHKVETQLRESERYYGTLLRSLHEDILVIDEAQVIVDANREVATAINPFSEKVKNRSCVEIFHAYKPLSDHGDDKFLIANVFRTGQPVNYRLENESANRMPASCLDVLLSPILDNDQKVFRVIMAVRDVTRETQLGRHINQFQKIEAIGTLAGGIAHEFNNILMSIQLNLELAKMCRALDNETAESLEVAYKASLKAKKLVNQVLIFSRQDKQGKYPLSATPLIKEGVKMLQSTLPENIRIRLTADASSDTISASPDQIHQVLINLCTNAAHAMAVEGGELTVSLKNSILEEANIPLPTSLGPGEYFVLHVEDTGKGMDQKVQDRIFDPFFTLKQPGEGTGLGLSVVHGIVKELQGDIIVESQPGKGSTFSVFFPLANVEEATESTPARPQRGGHKIIIVDDEQVLVDTIKRGLASMGYIVRAATSAETAIGIIQSESDDIDLVIADVTMPGKSGLDLAKELFRILPDLPVILCTGYSNVPHKDAFKETGIRDIALKPLNFRQLDNLIRKILSENNAGEPYAPH